MTMLQCVYIVPYEVLYARFFVLFHSCFASNNDACLGMEYYFLGNRDTNSSFPYYQAVEIMLWTCINCLSFLSMSSYSVLSDTRGLRR